LEQRTWSQTYFLGIFLLAPSTLHQAPYGEFIQMRILAIFAHPDDESYGPAGTLAKAARDGHIVSLLTLTHGESGSPGIAKNLSAAELARRRSRELHSAARKLDIQHLKIHNLSDKKLQDVPEQEGTGIIKMEINKFKPDIVITFHENTLSGHPDHLAVTKWTLQAVRAFPDPPTLLLYGLDQKQTKMISFRKLIPISDNEITHRIDVENFVDNKISAIQCHKTQNDQWLQIEKLNINFRKFAEWEIFVQKWPRPETGRIKDSLFQN
jgi:LmbE family N-acetylglucosaminyl deacetylase